MYENGLLKPVCPHACTEFLFHLDDFIFLKQKVCSFFDVRCSKKEESLLNILHQNILSPTIKQHTTDRKTHTTR